MWKFVVVVVAVVVFVDRRQLAGTPHEPHLRLLETFAYGTYADAQAKADQLPKLTDAQVGASPEKFQVLRHNVHRRAVHDVLHMLLLPHRSLISFTASTSSLLGP